MNVRTVPYGYKYEFGELTCHQEDSKIVAEIFHAYSSHESLLSIANGLNARKIEYREGVMGWNKSRVSRILQDERYCGATKFPSIIEKTVFAQVQELISSKNTQKGVDRRSGIFKIDVPVICPMCRSEMRRRCENQYTYKERWVCTNPNCKKMVVKTDTAFLEEITALLNQIIENPMLIKTPQKCDASDNEERRKLGNEIAIMFDSIDIPKERLKEKLFEYASQTYDGIDAVQSKTQRLIDIFTHERKAKEFSIRLFSQTVETVSLDGNNLLYITLSNGQEVRKES